MSRFPLVTMAGYAGEGDCCPTDPSCCNEGRIRGFASSVKAADAQPADNATRVLYYQNTLINFPQTELAAAVPESLLLHDTRGRLVYLGGCGATACGTEPHDLRPLAAADAGDVGGECRQGRPGQPRPRGRGVLRPLRAAWPRWLLFV